MASLACSRIEEVGRKAKTLLSQLETSGEMKHEDLIALKDELASNTFREELLEESEDEMKSAVNIEALFNILPIFYKLIERLVQKVSSQSKEFTEKIKEITEELEALKGDHIKLILGQLAFEVEKAIVNEVFTEVIGPPDKHYITTITDMQNALMRQANFADILADDSSHEKATEKWRELQRTLNWTFSIYQEFKEKSCASGSSKI
jgi:hypothetical protein